jgi:tryptophan synthase alpha chain
MTTLPTQKQVMAHCVFGFPTVDRSLDMIRAILDEGVDYLEIQYPFSDPVADGPSITLACHTALEQNIPFALYVSTLKEIANEYPKQKVIAMTYLNPLIQQNLASVALQWEGDVRHLIIPDLPIEQTHLIEPLIQHNIRPIWLITPGMLDTRVRLLAENTHEVLYCVTRDGVTGTNSNLNQKEEDQRYFDRVIAASKTPALAGFGIKTPEDAKYYARLCNGVVVGSVLLDTYRKAEDHNKGLIALRNTARSLIEAIK